MSRRVSLAVLLSLSAVASASEVAVDDAVRRATSAGADAALVSRVASRAEAAGVAEAELLGILERIRAAASSGLPADYLSEKALEGLAKGVPTQRLDAALAQLGERLAIADAALAKAKLGKSDAKSRGEAVRAAADALRGGATADQITALAGKAKSEKRGGVALDSLAGLIELGVPVEKAHAVVTRALALQLSDEKLSGLDRATATIAGLTGMAPEQAAGAAAEGLARGLAATQIADEHRGIRDGLTGRSGIGGTPAGATNPADAATSGALPGAVPGSGTGYTPPGTGSGFGNTPGGLPTPPPTGAPTATPPGLPQ